MTDSIPVTRKAFAGFTLLRDLSPEAPRQVLDSLRRKTLATGDVLCRQGKRGDSLFLIESGLIEVWLESPEGRHLVRRLRQGDIVGEMALLTGEPRSADVIANAPSTGSCWYRRTGRLPDSARNLWAVWRPSLCTSITLPGIDGARAWRIAWCAAALPPCAKRT